MIQLGIKKASNEIARATSETNILWGLSDITGDPRAATRSRLRMKRPRTAEAARGRRPRAGKAASAKMPWMRRRINAGGKE